MRIVVATAYESRVEYGMMLGLSSPAWSQPWQDVAGDLMSPACPGRTLLNCTSSQAEQWRELIRQKLAQGESKEQILRYFVDIGGEGILAAPPKQGFCFDCLAFAIVCHGEWGGINRCLDSSVGTETPTEQMSHGMTDPNAATPSSHASLTRI